MPSQNSTANGRSGMPGFDLPSQRGRGGERHRGDSSDARRAEPTVHIASGSDPYHRRDGDRRPTPLDIQPVENETRDRIITGLVTLIPFLAIGFAGWQVWGSALHWSDVFLFVGMYVFTGLGITVGFHRHLTHRSFKTKPVAARPARRSSARRRSRGR